MLCHGLKFPLKLRLGHLKKVIAPSVSFSLLFLNLRLDLPDRSWTEHCPTLSDEHQTLDENCCSPHALPQDHVPSVTAPPCPHYGLPHLLPCCLSWSSLMVAAPWLLSWGPKPGLSQRSWASGPKVLVWGVPVRLVRQTKSVGTLSILIENKIIFLICRLPLGPLNFTKSRQ